MAKEEEKTNEESEKSSGGKGKGKGSIIKLGIIGVAVLLLLGGGFFGWKMMSRKDVSKEEAEKAKQEEGKEEPGHMIPLESFVVNLADPDEVRYLKVTVNLEVDSEKAVEEITTRMPQIRDTLLMLLTSKTSDNVEDISGKLMLQDEMVARVNTFLKEGKVKAVYFTEFIMQ